MTQFLRVRDKKSKHEYDAPVREAELHPELYEVVDEVPVDAVRPPKHFVKSAKPQTPKSSVGKPKEGDA